MGCKLQHARRLTPEGSDAKGWEVLLEMNDAVMLIQIDEIERNHNSHGMNSAGGHDPDAFIGLEAAPADQPTETREGGISSGDAQAEEALTGLVVDAQLLFLHELPLSREKQGRAA
jgi:hypothetical protein